MFTKTTYSISPECRPSKQCHCNTSQEYHLYTLNPTDTHTSTEYDVSRVSLSYSHITQWACSYSETHTGERHPSHSFYFWWLLHSSSSSPPLSMHIWMNNTHPTISHTSYFKHFSLNPSVLQACFLMIPAPPW